MLTLKEDIILKIQNANDEQLLAEVYRILQADEYEVDDYKRVEVIFKSGKNGYIYIGK